MSGRKILITGSEGYLANQLVERLLNDNRVEAIIGVDIKDSPRTKHEKYRYIRMSIADERFAEKMARKDFDTIVHSAWTFNPTHDFTARDRLDIGGSFNILELAAKKSVEQMVYLGSTTAYGALPENPSSEPFLREEDWLKCAEKRMSTNYGYSRNKAIVDQSFRLFSLSRPDIRTFWIRGAIVLGPNTRNVVSYVAESPFTFGRYMFRVRGYDPPMQFLSEHDMTEVLYLATMNRWSGVVNVAGGGTVKYSDLIKTLGRKELCLPRWILYPFTEFLWKLRILKFPSSLIDLIRYPWVGDIGKLKKEFGYEPRFSSSEALRQFADAHKKSESP